MADILIIRSEQRYSELLQYGKSPANGGKSSRNVFELKKCVVLLCFFYENFFYENYFFGVLIKESLTRKMDYMSFLLTTCLRFRLPHFLITPNTIRIPDTPITIMAISPQSRLFSMIRVADAVAFP